VILDLDLLARQVCVEEIDRCVTLILGAVALAVGLGPSCN
jgi:hypothetical protein